MDHRVVPPDASLTEVWSEHDIHTHAEAIAHLGAWAWDIPTGRLWWTDEVYRILGLSPQQFTATYEGFFEYVHHEDRDRLQRAVDAAITHDEPYGLEHRVVRPDGDVRSVRERGEVTRAADGTPLRMLGIIQDITDEAALHKALEDSEQRHRLLAENAWDVIWTMALDGSISYVSPAVERVRGITPEEAMLQSIDQIHPPESAARVTEYFASLYGAIATGAEPPTFHGEQEYYRKDGSIMLGDLQVIPQVDHTGTVVRILGVTRDISDRRQYEQELHRLAVTDSLTGVWNRGHGFHLLTTELAASRRYGPPASVLMLDIDHFKAINDTYGHHGGDAVLVELCRRISDNLRPSDALIRWGGEEFLVLARHCRLDEAAPLAEKVRQLIADTPVDHAGTITASIGIAELQQDDDLDSWLRRADQALYDAKHAGRNTVRAR